MGNPYAGPRTPAVMEPVASGQIAKIGYHPESQTAVIQFSNGKVYQYSGVPPEMYDNLKNAESVGSFFAQNIKGRYSTAFRGTIPQLRSPNRLRKHSLESVVFPKLNAYRRAELPPGIPRQWRINKWQSQLSIPATMLHFNAHLDITRDASIAARTLERSLRKHDSNTVTKRPGSQIRNSDPQR